MCDYITCCFMAVEKRIDFVTTLNRMIKAHKWRVCWTNYNYTALLIADCADCVFRTAGCCRRGTGLYTDNGEILEKNLLFLVESGKGES